MQFDTIGYNIDKAFVFVLEYGDVTGLSDDDIKWLDDFLDNVKHHQTIS